MDRTTDRWMMDRTTDRWMDGWLEHETTDRQSDDHYRIDLGSMIQ